MSRVLVAHWREHNYTNTHRHFSLPVFHTVLAVFHTLLFKYIIFYNISCNNMFNYVNTALMSIREFFQKDLNIVEFGNITIFKGVVHF